MTLERILEPEVMDSDDEARTYDAMDHGVVNRRFVDDLLAAGLDASAGRTDDDAPLDVLDLGSGTAQIPIELCRRCADCRVMATDLAASMLDLAHYNVEIAGLGERIQLAQVDAKRLPFPDGSFAVVMSNSIVHHVPQPFDVLAEAVRAAAPGGLLFFRDLFRPRTADELQTLVDRYAGAEPETARLLFAASLHAALTVEEVRELVARLGFAPESVQATSDRHWTWAARKPA